MKIFFGVLVLVAAVIGFVVLARWVVGRLPKQTQETIGGVPILGWLLFPYTQGQQESMLETGAGRATG